MKTYSKTLDKIDYETTDEMNSINQVMSIFDSSASRPCHFHRKWEYGLCLNALRANGAKKILDVGGTGSIFPSCATAFGMDVTVVDPDGEGASFISAQNKIFNRPAIKFIQKSFFEYQTEEKFDAIVCLSTLEHIPDDLAFFQRLLKLVKNKGLVFLTVDFHPTGTMLVDGHLRTYNEERLNFLIEAAKLAGFVIYGNAPDYTWRGSDVDAYTFASLAFVKNENSKDFSQVPEVRFVEEVNKNVDGRSLPEQNVQYGLSLNTLRGNGASKILVIGGKDPVFVFAAASLGFKVTVLDQSRELSDLFTRYNLLISRPMITYMQQDPSSLGLKKKYDAVINFSGLQDNKDNLLKHVNDGGLLFFVKETIKKRKELDIPVVLFINNKTSKCGINQFGKRIMNTLKNSKKCQFVYVEAESSEEFWDKFNQYNPNGIIYNFHNLTMQWLDSNILSKNKRNNVFQASIFHDGVVNHFDYYISVDPNFPETEITFQTPRPLFEYENKFPLSKIPIINSFGFGFGSKGHVKLAHLVNQEFDEAILNFHIPFSHYCDPDGRNAVAIGEACRRAVTNKRIQVHVSHEFIPEHELHDFLAKGSLNAFLYDELNGSGCASTIDYALSVKRPIAITKSNMFRHIIDATPGICIEDRSLKEIMESGFGPLQPYYEKWKPANLLAAYENIVKALY